MPQSETNSDLGYYLKYDLFLAFEIFELAVRLQLLASATDSYENNCITHLKVLCVQVRHHFIFICPSF